MKFFLLCALLCGSVAMADNPRPTEVLIDKKAAVGNKFGTMVDGPKVTSLDDLTENFTDYQGKVVSFEAVPKKVCEKKGCWMILQDGDLEVRTLFKDYGFFVPADILGKKVRVQGVMEQKEVSAAAIRHYMKDEGKKMEEIKKVKTGEKQFQFVATGVEIINS